MGFATIVALDLGKLKSVCCVMDAATRTHAFATVPTTPAALHDFLAARTDGDGGSAAARTLVVLETCDCAGWVHDLARALGFAVAVANPSHDAWRWRKVKRKTDRDDALKLARMALMDQLPTVHVPAPRQRQRRRLIEHRRSLVRRRTQCKNAVRSIFSQQGLSERLPRGTGAWTAAGFARLRAEARPLAECGLDDLWRGRLHVELQLLETLAEQVKAVDAKLDARSPTPTTA